MRYLTIIVTILFVSTFGCYAQIDADIQEKVDELFSEWNNEYTPGVAIGVIQDGKLKYSKGYGIANLDYKIPITPDSKFYVASIAKQFTAACIALLSIEGEINLEDDIRKYFPEIPDYGYKITIQNLVHHTSGLRDYLSLMYLAGRSFEDYFNNEDAISLISKQQALNFKPNEEFLYSNSNYILLAELVKRVTSMTIREYASKNIFEPLRMKHTFFNDNHAQTIENRVISYRKNEENEYNLFVQNFDGHGDGGMISTINDIFLWDQNFYDKKVGGEEFINLMLSQEKLNNGYLSNYAFGLEHGNYKGLKIIVHGGNFLGFNHHFTRYPDQKFSIIVLSNTLDVNPYFITDRISEIFLKNEFNAPVSPAQSNPKSFTSIKLNKQDLQDFTSNYWDYNNSFSRNIYVRNDTLRYDRGMNNESALIPIAKNEFKMLVDGAVRVKFEINGKGKRQMAVNVNEGSFFNFEEYQPFKYQADELVNFAGSYYSPELNCNYTLRIEEGKLVLYIDNKRASPVTPVMENLFTNDFVGTITFNAENQKIFVINSNRVRGIKFHSE